MSTLTDRLAAEAAPQRDEYARLRLEGHDCYEAGRQMDLSEGRRRRYEAWARVDHPELTGPARADWGKEWRWPTLCGAGELGVPSGVVRPGGFWACGLALAGSFARVLAAVIPRPLLPRQLKGPNLLA